MDLYVWYCFDLLLIDLKLLFFLIKYKKKQKKKKKKQKKKKQKKTYRPQIKRCIFRSESNAGDIETKYSVT